MKDTLQIGLYGKLPAYGDFITRNLNADFIAVWDEWLQHYISASREQIGDEWLDIYLTSPIWRFAFSSGVINERVWAGILMPSVDRVGRYFPISIVKPFHASVSPVNLIAHQHAWFEQLEAQCLSALDGEMDADELSETVAQLEFSPTDLYQPTVHLGEQGSMVVGLKSADLDATTQVLPYLLNANLSSAWSSFSLWQTDGSDLISPAIFCSQGLPAIGGIASMLDGQWQKRNWKIPYNPML
jgi:type VI secretion system protein ImpM